MSQFSTDVKVHGAEFVGQTPMRLLAGVRWSGYSADVPLSPELFVVIFRFNQASARSNILPCTG